MNLQQVWDLYFNESAVRSLNPYTYMGTLYQSQRVRSHCSPETQTNRINKSGPYMFAAAENSTALQDTESFVGQSVTLLSATDKHFAFHNFAPGPRTDFISKLQDFALRSLDPLGWHSDQGSIFPGTHQDSRSRKNISEHSDQLLAQNFEAVLAVIAIWAVDTIFAKNQQEVQKHILRHSQERYRIRDSSLYFSMTKDHEIIPGNMLSKDRGSWNHTRRYTF